MIKLLTKQTLELYKLQNLQPLTFLKEEDTRDLIFLCCTVNFLDTSKTVYCLDITLKKNYTFFVETYTSQELKSLCHNENLLLITEKKYIQKLKNMYCDYFCTIDLVLDKKNILLSYFKEKNIAITNDSVSFLLDHNNDDILSVINDVYVSYLANPKKTISILSQEQNQNIFNIIDTIIMKPQVLDQHVLINQMGNPKNFLGFLSLLEKKLELLLILKILSKNYSLKDISVLIDKNIYYLKNSLVLANNTSIYRINNLIHVISEIDYMYKHGLINEENSITRIMS